MDSSPLALIAKQCWHHNLVLMVSEEHWVCSGCLFFVHLGFFFKYQKHYWYLHSVREQKQVKNFKMRIPIALEIKPSTILGQQGSWK